MVGGWGHRRRLLGTVVMVLAVVGAPVAASSHERSLLLDPIEEQVAVAGTFRMTAHLCPRGVRPGPGSGCRPAPGRTTWAIEDGRNRIAISRRRGRSIEVTGRRVGTAEVSATVRLDASTTFISRTHVHVVDELSEPPPVPEEALVVHRTDVSPAGVAFGKPRTARLGPTSERPGRLLLQTQPGDTSAFFRADTWTVPTYMAYRCPADERGFAIVSADGVPGSDDECMPEVVNWQLSPWQQAFPGRSTGTAIILAQPAPQAILATAADGLQGAATLDVVAAEGPAARLVVDPPIMTLGPGEASDARVLVCTFDTWQVADRSDEPATDEGSLLIESLLGGDASAISGCEPLEDTAAVSWSVIGDGGVSLSETAAPTTTVTGAEQGRVALVVRAQGFGDGVAFVASPIQSTCPEAGHPGDFNGDGSVDAADYVEWRKTDGSPTGYETWRANFGARCP